MTITTIKLSQEINFNGMPTWIGLEAALLPGENEKDGLRSLQKSITDYVKEEQEKLPKSTWMPKAKAEVSDANKETIDAINNCNTMEELNTYKFVSNRNLSILEAWKKKESELTA